MRDMPLDGLKIDASFVTSEKLQEANKLILKCLLECAEAFNMEICAKRIETKEAHDFLQDLGIHVLQGYYYSRPLSLTNLQQFINSQK